MNTRACLCWLGLVVLAAGINLAHAVDLGRWSIADIDALLDTASTQGDAGMKVDYISKHFINTRYKAHTLVGNAQTDEQMVVRLDALDCMTYIENVEALRRSHTFMEYLENLQRVRYRNGVIKFDQRNHFFADWKVSNAPWIQDVTVLVGNGEAVSVNKSLNRAESKILILGIPVVNKTVHYIPSAKIDLGVLARLRTGDYVGNYSPLLGLDVNHVGIVIKQGNHVYFRHANADERVRKVMDSDFIRFFKRESGIIVFRPY